MVRFPNFRQAAVITCLLLFHPSFGYGQIQVGGGDDIDPKNLPVGVTWAQIGVKTLTYYVMDNTGKCTTFTPRNYWAVTKLGTVPAAPLCRDNSQPPNHYNHVYFENDYANVADADRYSVVSRIPKDFCLPQCAL
jgi:hypothetical protein